VVYTITNILAEWAEIKEYKCSLEESMARRQSPAPEDLESQQWKVV